MNDEELESILQSADRSAVPKLNPSPALAAAARKAGRSRQAREQRIRTFAGLAICYAAGLLSMWLALPSISSVETKSAAKHQTIGNGAPKHDASRSASDNTVGTLVARVDVDRKGPFGEFDSYQMWRKLGDRSQLTGNYEMALKHYSKAVEQAGPADLEISYATDNWLLIRLKKDRIASATKTQKGTSI